MGSRVHRSKFVPTPVAAPPSTDPQFPRISGYLIGNPHNYGDSSYQAEIAQLDLAILGMYNGWGAASTAVNAIRALNPSILLGNYTITTEVPSNSGNPATATRWTKLTNEVGPGGVGNWWAYDTGGAHTDWAGGAFNTWDTNLTLLTTPDVNGDRYPQYAAKLDYTQIMTGVNWDIWFNDNSFWKPRSDADWNRDGVADSRDNLTVKGWWRAGQRAYYDQAKTSAPSLKLMVNADSDLDGSGPYPGGTDTFTQYENVCHGALMERIMGETWSAETWGGWSTAMGWYRALKANLLSPQLLMFEIGPVGTDYQYFRYAFASCLMDDGYFCVDIDGNTIPWFDEYDLAGTASTKWLGAAIDGPQTTAWQLGVYRRRFANGVVLVNPKGNGARTVTLGTGYTRFTGSQAPAVNSGATVTSTVTLQDRDAIFLVTEGGGGGGGSVAFDAVGPSSAGQSASGGATSMSWSHTCSGANRYVVVGVSNAEDSSSTTVTFGGVSMTSLGKVHSNNSTSGYVELFGLVNPTVGASTVVVSSTIGSDLTGGSISFNGVHQTTPAGSPFTAFGDGSGATVIVTGTTAGNLVVGTIANGASIISSDQTSRYICNLNTGSAAGNSAGATTPAGGSVTLSWGNTSDWWGIVAIEVKTA